MYWIYQAIAAANAKLRMQPKLWSKKRTIRYFCKRSPLLTDKFNNLLASDSAYQPQNRQPQGDPITSHSLIEANIKSLKEGAELLQLLSSDQYQQAYQAIFQSTIGAHFRHILEHYRCFILQLEQRVFCYDERERDELLEGDYDCAVNCIAEIVDYLQHFDSDWFNHSYQLKDCQMVHQLPTTVERELLFLQSHTVHHYALIGAMARSLGVRPKADFGVAIATQRHQNKACRDESQQLVKTDRSADPALQTGDSTCAR